MNVSKFHVSQHVAEFTSVPKDGETQATIVVVPFSIDGPHSLMENRLRQSLWIGAHTAFDMFEKSSHFRDINVELEMLVPSDSETSDSFLRSVYGSPRTLAVIASGAPDDVLLLDRFAAMTGVPTIIGNPTPIDETNQLQSVFTMAGVNLPSLADKIHEAVEEIRKTPGDEVLLLHETKWATWCHGSTTLKENIKEKLGVPGVNVLRIGKKNVLTPNKVFEEVSRRNPQLIVYLGDQFIESMITSLRNDDSISIIHVTESQRDLAVSKSIPLHPAKAVRFGSMVYIMCGEKSLELPFSQRNLEHDPSIPNGSEELNLFAIGFDAASRVLTSLALGNYSRVSIKSDIEEGNLTIDDRKY